MRVDDGSFSKNVMVVEKLDTYAGPKDFAPAHETDAGIDLYVAHGEEFILGPKEWTLVGTGVKIALPFMTEGQVRTKSGRALRNGLIVLNSPGTIDPGYRGEVKAIMYNVGESSIKVDAGEKIAQLVLSEFRRPHVDYGPVEDDTIRGTGGFGSTGVKTV